MAERRIPIIGILGGIGSGKSTVAQEFEALGCGRIDADAIGHGLYNDPEVVKALRERFGDEICDPLGRVDRKKLGDAAFAAPANLQALNDLMHPRIRQRMAEQIDQMLRQSGFRALVVDAALLLETDWQELCTVFVFVDAPAEERRRRVMQTRPTWDEATWKRREKSQKSLDIKRARAEYVVDNRFSDSRLREQVRSVLQRILQDGG